MVVDAFIRHRVTVVAPTEESVDLGAADTEGFRRDVQHIAEYFYANDVLLALNWVACLQRAFTKLTELFVHLSLCKNIAETVSMYYEPCHTLGGHSVESYGL